MLKFALMHTLQHWDWFEEQYEFDTDATPCTPEAQAVRDLRRHHCMFFHSKSLSVPRRLYHRY
jgi:hypothetical protein